MNNNGKIPIRQRVYVNQVDPAALPPRNYQVGWKESEAGGAATFVNAFPHVHWEESMALRVATGINQAVQSLVRDNNLHMLKPPILRRTIMNPDEDILQDSADRLSTWFAATASLDRMFHGSIITEILHLRDLMLERLGEMPNVTIDRSNGTPRIFVQPPQNR